MKKSFILLFLCLAKGWCQIHPIPTLLTKNLYQNLRNFEGKGVFLGHQDALAYGLNADGSRWIGEKDRSDIHSVSGEFPAVLGLDLGRIELGTSHNLDQVPFEDMKVHIRQTYERGGFSTISWHLNNPVNPEKTSWDHVPGTVSKILEDPEVKSRYLSWLDLVAAFLSDLKTSDGDYIPVIFRPFHEHTGSWFWWGADHCTPDEYKALWKLTVDYLFQKKKLNHILIAYSTDVFRDKAHYLERYPGDEYVDLLGVDTYHRNAPESNTAFVHKLRSMLSILDQLSTEKKKPYAITETGLEQITEKDWWSNVVVPALHGFRPSYLLLWRNGYDKHYYAPYPGQGSVADFKEVLKSGKLILSNGIQGIYR